MRGGGLCYGYDVVTTFDAAGDPVRGERTINEDEATVVRRVFRDFASSVSPLTIARRLNAEKIPCPSGKLWTDSTIRGQVKRGTGLINNALYVGRLVWNRLRYVKNPETGKRVSRINPKEEWITTEVPELRIIDDELWQAVKVRQEELTAKYATVIEATRTARANRLNGTHRPRHLLSGLLECGVCGGPYSMRGQDRYGCSNHVMNDSCSNGRGIRRTELEERVLVGPKDRLMAPEAADAAVRAWAEETHRLDRERSASGEADRKELADVEKKIEGIVVAIQDGAYSPALKERLHKLEARKEELTRLLATVPREIPDIHPNVAGIYRRKVARLANALSKPEERDAAAAAIRGLIDGIVLTPSEKRGQLQVTLRGELGRILEWTGSGAEKEMTDTPLSGMSVSVVAEARNQRGLRLDEVWLRGRAWDGAGQRGAAGWTVVDKSSAQPEGPSVGSADRSQTVDEPAQRMVERLHLLAEREMTRLVEHDHPRAAFGRGDHVEKRLALGERGRRIVVAPHDLRRAARALIAQPGEGVLLVPGEPGHEV